MGSDQNCIISSASIPAFQSTLPHGERHAQTEQIDTANQFQSTLPHGERQTISLASMLDPMVSIHAPAWGATLPDRCQCDRLQFQSTLPHGERRVAITTIQFFFLSFNPRSRMGSDWTTGLVVIQEMFQSTLPHGERHRWHPSGCSTCLVSIHAPAWGATG